MPAHPDQSPLERTLREIFGFNEFRAFQREIVEDLVGGTDAFVLMPTGGGKSLCYQMAALHRAGVGIVVSPLISLMKDQVDALRASGVAAAFYNSSLEGDEARAVLARLHRGELDLLYVSPERVLSESFLERLAQVEVALFAIDEAHCVSQWGHDFRPEYAALGALKERFPDVPTAALTATADPQTRDDVIAVLGLARCRRYVTGFDRPNIRYAAFEKQRPFEQLLTRVLKHPGQSGIVYAPSRKGVDELAERLRGGGVKAAPYHAGLGAATRKSVQERFIRDEIDVVVATVAFGMGIDKPDVRFVVHYNLPKNIESYYQETGRAGRDGLPSEALLLFGNQDIVMARSLIETVQDRDQQRIELHKLNAMVDFAESVTCRRRVLLSYFGEQLDRDCGNCDVCLDPPQRFDVTVEAQKALSCVYRLRQRYGIRHVVDVLRGADTQRIRMLGHDRLSTYGIGRDRSDTEWHSILRQLVHRGLLMQDIANYSILKLTEGSRAMLRGESRLELALPRVREKKAAKRRRAAPDGPYDAALFERLRALRKRLADEEGKPPYIVFGDATLIHMARERPRDRDALLDVTGVGLHKLDKYGEEFLREIAAHGEGGAVDEGE